jgi:hypothetical protein
VTQEEKLIRRLQQNREWRQRNRAKLRPKQRAALKAWRERMKLNPQWRAEQCRKAVAYHQRKRAVDPVYDAKSKERKRRYYRKLTATDEGRDKVRKIGCKRYHQIKADPIRRRKYLEAERARRAKRKKRDPNFALRCHLRQRLSDVIRRGHATKLHSALALTGCSIAELRYHLEDQFKRGMTWANYGRVWHIDHIIPCAKFDFTDERQQRLCFHYLNLQPLRARENLRKQDKLVAPAQLPLLLSASQCTEVDR